MRSKHSIPILIADDDLDDCEMIRDALKESRLLNEVHFVHDGEQLLEFLFKQCDLPASEKKWPGLILLDLNMPKMDGREVLKELKKHPDLHKIPVIVLTTSQAEEDIMRSYNLGANSFITKPIEFQKLVELMSGLGRYWFEIVELPAIIGTNNDEK
jgi:CheY-like chemotaxis protein